MAIINGKISCSTCKKRKTLAEFQPAIVLRGCGQCKPCKYASKRVYEKKNQDLYNEKRRDYARSKGIEWRRGIAARALARNPELNKDYGLRRYGIDLCQYKTILKKQNSRCACCGTQKNSDGKSLYVDHCHSTGKIRGLLCRKCNTGIGLLGDSLPAIRRALKYMEASKNGIAT